MSTDPASATQQDDKAQRLILRGSGSAAAGLLIRVGARMLFLVIAARLFGAALFGAYSLADRGGRALRSRSAASA